MCVEFWWSHWMCLENSRPRICVEGEILLSELIKVWVV